jgi:hypothetical protein
MRATGRGAVFEFSASSSPSPVLAARDTTRRVTTGIARTILTMQGLRGPHRRPAQGTVGDRMGPPNWPPCSAASTYRMLGSDFGGDVLGDEPIPPPGPRPSD